MNYLTVPYRTPAYSGLEGTTQVSFQHRWRRRFEKAKAPKDGGAYRP
jgi:hypothetical protein